MTKSRTHTYGQLHSIPQNELHRTFGGIISESDFSTERHYRTSNESSMASRILTARKFDQQCLRNAINRDQNNNNKAQAINISDKRNGLYERHINA